ncbi:indole-3-glycerol phosphate synthase TrpC [Bacillus sp. 2205SS5-2]|uniref:indole-3-glycerol phosphate synthase TrpC n=1 Tax=Bacillus sp. 2205SS5-2 TaxID=3109031 RepID=UPI003006E4EE
MKTILDTIIAKKKEEVAKLQESSELKINRSVKRSLFNQLNHRDHLAIIAEIKRASPSKGDILVDVDPVQQAILYAEAGVEAISVLTDELFFKGSMEDLRAVRMAVNTPLLCKDFFIHESQIDIAKQAGADIILLIVAALSPKRLSELFHYCQQEGLEVLVEVHDEGELMNAIKLGASLIGINNRNLHSFDVDLAITENLMKVMKNRNIKIISESGIKGKSDAERVAAANVDGILVGETLMRSKDIKGTISQLQASKELKER